MPIKVDEVIQACEVLAREENLNKCVQESAQGALLAGGGALIGGLLGGPRGIVAGLQFKVLLVAFWYMFNLVCFNYQLF